MGKIKDLTGQTRNRLTAIRCVGVKGHNALWLCSCLCRNEIEVTSGHFLSNHTRSCGCWKSAVTAARNTEHRGENSPMFGRRGKDHPQFKHGYNLKNPVYLSWHAMKKRCLSPLDKDWLHYGGAGVKIDPRWLNKEHGFENFLADMGERPEATTLGRFGDVGNYCKENCAWQTRKEQEAERKAKRQLALLAA